MSLCLLAQHSHDEESATEPVDHTKLSGVGLYDWLGNEGYYNDAFTDDELQKLVADGLASDDPNIVSATISSLAWYALHSLTQRDESGNPKFDRDLDKVPALKQTLIDVWQANKNEESYPLTEEDVDNSVEYRNELLVLSHEFAWSFVPPTLAALFPKDADVHAVLWEGFDPDNPTTMLDWLNRGQFTTEKATELRMELLSSIEGTTPVFAAIGLGFTESDEALTALVERLQKDAGDRTVRAHLIDSIVAHGDRAVPHLELLKQTAEESALLPSDGSKLERPEGYGIVIELGIEYRTQQALLSLEELQGKESEEL